MYFCSKRVLKQIPFVTVRLKFMAISFPQIKVQEQKFLKEVVVSLRLFDILFKYFPKNIIVTTVVVVAKCVIKIF